MSCLIDSYGLTLEQSSCVFCNALHRPFIRSVPVSFHVIMLLTSKAVKATVDRCMCYRQLVATPVLTFD